MTLKEKMQAALKAARDLAAKAESESREFTAEERQLLAGHLNEAKGLKEQLAAAEGDAALRKSIEELGAGLDLKTGADAGVQQAVAAGKGASIGQQFVESSAFKGWLAQVAPGGEVSHSAKGFISPPVAFKSLLTGEAATSAGAFVNPDHSGIYEPLGRRPLVIRDLISVRSTESDTVDFVRQATRANNAAPVAEATATGNGTGAAPESGMTFEQVTETVKSIEHWMPATRRALSDAAQLRGLIDQELREGLDEKLEDQILSGDGTGQNFTGILNTTGTLSQAYSATVAGLDPLIETTRKALTTLRTTGRARPTAYVFNPTDWERIELARLAKNPQNDGSGRSGAMLHGIPVVESEAMPAGVGGLADWRKAVLWDRQRATLQVSDSHQDFFIRSLVAILSSMRAAFGVVRPSAFIEIDLTA